MTSCDPGSTPVTTPPTPLDLLTGEPVEGILVAALEPEGREPLRWRVTQVLHRPARDTIVAYRVRVREPGGAETEETMVVSSGLEAAGAVELADGRTSVAVWCFPDDPVLPGLAAAWDPGAVADLLRRLGAGGDAPGSRDAVGPVRLRLRAYRPGRRAVIEARSPGGRIFLKVVPPARVQDLHRRHRMLASAGVPVARSLGWSATGILVLEALPGRTFRQELWRGAGLPDADALLGLLDGLPGELADGPRRRSWLERSPYYASIVGAALPAEGGRVRELGEALAVGAGAEVERVGTATERPVPIHGDIHDQQVLVSAGQISGVLDVDGAGPGDRLDDLACFLGHLELSVGRASAAAGRDHGLVDRYLATFDTRVDPVGLRSRMAAVLLSLATGPHRVQERDWPAVTRARLDLAERWLESARRMRRVS